MSVIIALLVVLFGATGSIVLIIKNLYYRTYALTE